MESTDKPKRDYALDVLRAIAAIYIIGFWHHVDYVDLEILKTTMTRTSAIIALGVFFIVSAYLLTSQQMSSISSQPEGKERHKIIYQFYMKRVLRIYPLYAVAVFLFFYAEIGHWTLPHLITSLTLVAAVIDKSPLTLWFINVIFLYYLALPFFLFYMRTNGKIILSASAIFILLFVMHRVTPLIDERIYVYLPSMIFGILLGKNSRIKNFSKGGAASSISFVCLCVALLLIHKDITTVENMSFILPLLVFPFLQFLSQGIANIKKFRFLWIWIGYASFSAYLFHRVLYLFMYQAVGSQDLDSVFLALLMSGVAIVVIIFSFGVQYFYDLCIRNVQNNLNGNKLKS